MPFGLWHHPFSFRLISARSLPSAVLILRSPQSSPIKNIHKTEANEFETKKRNETASALFSRSQPRSDPSRSTRSFPGAEPQRIPSTPTNARTNLSALSPFKSNTIFFLRLLGCLFFFSDFLFSPARTIHFSFVAFALLRWCVGFRRRGKDRRAVSVFTMRHYDWICTCVRALVRVCVRASEHGAFFRQTFCSIRWFSFLALDFLTITIFRDDDSALECHRTPFCPRTTCRIVHGRERKTRASKANSK